MSAAAGKIRQENGSACGSKRGSAFFQERLTPAVFSLDHPKCVLFLFSAFEECKILLRIARAGISVKYGFIDSTDLFYCAALFYLLWIYFAGGLRRQGTEVIMEGNLAVSMRETGGYGGRSRIGAVTAKEASQGRSLSEGEAFRRCGGAPGKDIIQQ